MTDAGNHFELKIMLPIKHPQPSPDADGVVGGVVVISSKYFATTTVITHEATVTHNVSTENCGWFAFQINACNGFLLYFQTSRRMLWKQFVR